MIDKVEKGADLYTVCTMHEHQVRKLGKFDDIVSLFLTQQCNWRP